MGHAMTTQTSGGKRKKGTAGNQSLKSEGVDISDTGKSEVESAVQQI